MCQKVFKSKKNEQEIKSKDNIKPIRLARMLKLQNTYKVTISIIADCKKSPHKIINVKYVVTAKYSSYN